MKFNKLEDKNSLYQQLEDLKEARKILNSAIHNNFYNRTVVEGLYEKLKIVNSKINKIRYQIKKEKNTNAK